MIERDRDIVFEADGSLKMEAVIGAIQQFRRSVLPTMQEMIDAYHNEGAITHRQRSKGVPNNKLSHAYARYIVTIASGYLVGKPITYSVPEESHLDEQLEAFKKVCKDADLQSVDAELAAKASIYGKGVNICYADGESRPMSASLDPRSAFVVYDDTVQHLPLFGVDFHDVYDLSGQKTGCVVHAYTGDMIYCYKGADAEQIRRIPELDQEHYFGGVPIVEFWNNEDELGDFQPVLSLIEGYDNVESDRVNDKEQFSDAILLLTGCQSETEEDEEEEDDAEEGEKDRRSFAQKLLEEKVLSLPDEEAKAEWLTKTSDEAGTDILRKALNNDIHKMSMVPDLTDENFASNASGVAMKYKLFGLEQLVSIKERWFREAVRARIELIEHFMAVKAQPTLAASDVEISFTRSLPANDAEIASMVATLDGIVSREDLLPQLPFITDVRKSLDKLERQQAEESKRQAEAFGGRYQDANEPQENDESGTSEEEPDGEDNQNKRRI